MRNPGSTTECSRFMTVAGPGGQGGHGPVGPVKIKKMVAKGGRIDFMFLDPLPIRPLDPPPYAVAP